MSQIHQLTALIEREADGYVRRLDAWSALAATTARELETGVYATPEAADAALAARAKAMPPMLRINIDPVDRR